MDEAELRDDDLHEKRMARLKKEREEKEAMRAEVERLQAALRDAREALQAAASYDADPAWDAARKITEVLEGGR